MAKVEVRRECLVLPGLGQARAIRLLVQSLQAGGERGASMCMCGTAPGGGKNDSTGP